MKNDPIWEAMNKPLFILIRKDGVRLTKAFTNFDLAKAERSDMDNPDDYEIVEYAAREFLEKSL